MEAKSAVSVQQNIFDYGELPGSDIKRCESAAERITRSQRRMAADIIAIGKELLTVKEKLEHGQFGKWIKHYFGWSHQTANNMMQAADMFGKLQNFGNLTIDTSALYLLSSNKCPDETRDEIIERAEQGERITHAKVKEHLEVDQDEPSFDDRIDKIVDRIRSLAKCDDRQLLIARLKVLCEELSSD